MVAIALGESLRAVFVGEVDAVFHWQRRKFRANLVPLRHGRESEALAPLLGDGEAVIPVFELVGGIPGFARRMIFLGRNNGRPEHVPRGRGVIVRETCHEFGALEDYVAIMGQRWYDGPRGVDQLRQGDGVGLLPYQERVNVAGTAATVLRRHLGPARAAVPL